MTTTRKRRRDRHRKHKERRQARRASVDAARRVDRQRAIAILCQEFGLSWLDIIARLQREPMQIGNDEVLVRLKYVCVESLATFGMPFERHAMTATVLDRNLMDREVLAINADIGLDALRYRNGERSIRHRAVSNCAAAMGRAVGGLLIPALRGEASRARL